MGQYKEQPFVQESSLGLFLLDFWNASHADYTLAFQGAYAALLAANGGDLELPPNLTMDVAAQLNVPANTTTHGPASAIVRAKAGTSISVFTATGKANIHFIGFTIDGNLSNVSGGNGFNLVACTDCSIRFTTILNPWNDGIILDANGATPCYRVLVEGNTVSGSGSHGIALSGTVGNSFSGGPQECRIIGNHIEEHGGAGINVSQSAACTVTGNTIRRTSLTVTGWGGIRLSNGTAFTVVTGNTVTGSSRGILITSDAGAGDGPDQYNVVSGNTLRLCLQHGILCQSPNNTIAENTVVDCAQDATFRGTDGSALRVDSINQCTVRGGHVIDTTATKHATAVLVSAADYCTVEGVTIIGYTVLPLTVSGANSQVSRINTTQTTDLAVTGGTLTLRDHSDWYNITGAGNITNFTLSRKGRVVVLQFNAADTITNSATVKLQGGVNFVTKAGDTLTLECDGVNGWRESARCVS